MDNLYEVYTDGSREHIMHIQDRKLLVVQLDLFIILVDQVVMRGIQQLPILIQIISH